MIYVVTLTFNNKNGSICTSSNWYVGTDREKAYSIIKEKVKNVKYFEDGTPEFDCNVSEWEDGRIELPNKTYWGCR